MNEPSIWTLLGELGWHLLMFFYHLMQMVIAIIGAWVVMKWCWKKMKE